MKKLFFILAVAAATAFASCSQQEELIEPMNDLEQTQQPVTRIISTPQIAITGGVFPARGRWQVRVTVSNPMMQTVTFNNIVVKYYHEASKTTYSSQTTSVTLEPAGQQQCYLNFDKLPGGLNPIDTCKITAYASCSPISKTIVSPPYYATLK